MHASEVMTTNVISTSADTPVREVARTMFDHGISAMPVLGADGIPIGMVSEGDLVSRDEPARLERRDWWLKLLADDAAPDDSFLANLRAPGRTVGDVMSAPVVSVGEDTEVTEVVRLVTQHHIKRVPVVKDGRLVGIVSRANLLRALTAVQEDVPADRLARRGRGFLLNMFGEYHRPAWEVISPHAVAAPNAPKAEPSATVFRTLVEDFHTGETRRHEAARRAATDRRHQLATELIDTHVSDDAWQALLRHAQQAAGAGEKECLLLRFPNELCTDGGRMIDVAHDSWPATLRGEAAEIYLRWEHELKHAGFHLAARVLEYPNGMPGDIGLFLVWGEQQ